MLDDYFVGITNTAFFCFDDYSFIVYSSRIFFIIAKYYNLVPYYC